MSDYSKDDLNKFIKSKLEGAQPDNMWNVPPDFVFDNAINKVNELRDKEEKKKVYWPWLTLLLLFLISGVLWQVSKVNKNQSNEILALKKQIDETNLNLKSLENSMTEKLDNLTQVVSSLNDSKVHQVELTAMSIDNSISTVQTKTLKNGESVKKDNRSYKDKIVKGSNAILNDNLIAKSKIGEEQISAQIGFNSAPLNDQISLIPSLEDETSDQTPVIKSISNLFGLKNQEVLPLLNYERKFIENYIAFDENLDDEVFNEEIKYGLLMTQNFSSLSMNNIPQGCELTQYDQNYHGIGVELQAEKAISKRWSMQFSMGYQNVNNESEMVFENAYNESNEEMGINGEMNYNMDFTFVTPFGDIDAYTEFELPSEAASDEMIYQHTFNKQQLNILSFNIGPKFNILNGSKWQFYLNSSLSYNRILHYENDMQTAMKMEDKTMTEFRSTPKKIDDINKNFLSVSGGFGLGHNFTERLGVTVGTQFSRSLNSLRVSRTSTDPKTQLVQLSTSIGLNYKF